MKDKQSKKVVIINDIRSDAIEQAIFILRSAGTPADPLPSRSHIVAQAQSIIDAYARTVEKTPTPSYRSRDRRLRLLRRSVWVLAAVSGFITVGWLILSFFGRILENF